MKKKRSNCLITIGVLVGLLAALACGLAVLGTALPRLAAADFGPPAPGLDPLQRAVLSAQVLLAREQLTQAENPQAGEQTFEVGLGEATGGIVRRLQDEGLVGDAGAFLTYLRYSGLDTTIQAGEFRLSARMTPVEIAHTLQDATPGEVMFHLLSGWRLEEIAANLATSGLAVSPEDFLQAANLPPAGHPLAAEIPAGASLEGFLPPGEYLLPRETGAEAFIRALLDRFEEQTGPDLRSGFDRQGLTLYESVTLASIVERESVAREEMPLIASVFLNRLQAGMKLDSDPTVQYALGPHPESGMWWPNPLTFQDLEIDSPYNTYLYPGLPPGPIAAPSLEALQAVAYPAQTPYYYFRAACDSSGRHLFAETFEEHVGNECP